MATERFDQIVLACHSDQALAPCRDATEGELDVLGAIQYQDNDAVLHTDASLLPTQRKAWAAWNAFIPRAARSACTVSYCMNVLQGIASPEPFIVTLNGGEAIDSDKVLRRMRYQHPVYEPCFRRGAIAQGRDPRAAADLVCGRVLGLGFP